MRHEQVRDHLSAYIEKSLEPALAGAVANHLRECDACRRQEESLRAVFQALADPSLNVLPPPMFHADVMRRIRLQQPAPADKRGLLERLGWARASAAGAAALAALALVVVAVGPLGDGMRGGFAPAVPAASAPSPFLIRAENLPARAGNDVRLRMAPPPGGPWSRHTEASSGLVTRAAEGAYTVLAVRPSAAGTVQEALVEFRNARSGATAARMVFLPVQTGGRPDALWGWRTPSGATLHSVLADAARAYGVVVTAPSNALGAPVSVQLDGADAVTAMQAIARASGFRYTLEDGAYHFRME